MTAVILKFADANARAAMCNAELLSMNATRLGSQPMPLAWNEVAEIRKPARVWGWVFVVVCFVGAVVLLGSLRDFVAA